MAVLHWVAAVTANGGGRRIEVAAVDMEGSLAPVEEMPGPAGHQAGTDSAVALVEDSWSVLG